MTVPIQEANGTTQTGSNGSRRQLASLGKNGVVVDELVLGVGQREELREDRVDCNILWLPAGLGRLNLSNLVERCRSGGECSGRKVAVEFDEEASSDVAVEVQHIDSVDESIAN